LQGDETQHAYDEALEEVEAAEMSARITTVAMLDVPTAGDPNAAKNAVMSTAQVRRELISIRSLLSV
jgi:hypothetical protein